MKELIIQIDKCLKIADNVVKAYNARIASPADSYSYSSLPCSGYCPGVNNYITELKKLAKMIANFDSIMSEKISGLLANISVNYVNGHKCFDIYTACRIDSLLGYLRQRNDFGKKKKIFISHATKDEDYAKAFVKCFESLGLTNEHIFCSSVPKFRIPIGSGDIFTYLRHEFTDNNLLVLMMLSDNYYSSKACLNEMGAAWIRQENYQSILLPGFTYAKIDGAINPRDITFKLDDKTNRKDRMDELLKLLFDYIQLPIPKKETWETERNKFLLIVDKIQKKQQAT